MNAVKTATPLNAQVLNSLLHNGIVIRAVALALATIILIAAHHPTWVPYSVSLYAIWNAASVTWNSARGVLAVPDSDTGGQERDLHALLGTGAAGALEPPDAGFDGHVAYSFAALRRRSLLVVSSSAARWIAWYASRYRSTAACFSR